ncbi:MAG: lysophospholipid acyltransferase family protein [Campylobacterales bacterium]|nr:lysophospholipid acyltransferase family protein [Campylobacterales bacterium]
MLKKFFRSLALVIVPLLGSLLIRFIYFTNKKVFHTPKSIAEEPTIFACWHGELLMLSHLYSHYRKIPHAKALISSHFDGSLVSKTIKHFGLDTIEGSTNRNAARALIQAIKALKDGYDIGITPDGPKGPRHEVADGIVVMAQKTKAKIFLVEIKATKYWKLSSWDEFVIPKPFGTLHFFSNGLIDVSKMELEEARTFIKNSLLEHEKVNKQI